MQVIRVLYVCMPVMLPNMSRILRCSTTRRRVRSDMFFVGGSPGCLTNVNRSGATLRSLPPNEHPRFGVGARDVRGAVEPSLQLLVGYVRGQLLRVV